MIPRSHHTSLRAHVALFALLLVLAGVTAREHGEQKVSAQKLIGLDADQVLNRLGPPARVSRLVYLHRSQEQWHYGAPQLLRLTFDCPRGQKPAVQHVRKIAHSNSPVNP
jgi:hypothetical protein